MARDRPLDRIRLEAAQPRRIELQHVTVQLRQRLPIGTVHPIHATMTVTGPEGSVHADLPPVATSLMGGFDTPSVRRWAESALERACELAAQVDPWARLIRRLQLREFMASWPPAEDSRL